MSVLRTVLERIRYGGNVERRTRRYVATGAIACASVWVLSLGYLALAPKTYTSGFVLVMPGTATGASVNLPTLGQAQSTSSSPFASAELSPTENYRKMLLNNRLIEMASAEAGEAKETFPLPKVELADQTKLISLKVTGRTPEQAAKRADAIRRAFLAMLDTLRIDEIKTREETFRTTLGSYKFAVNEARQRLTDYEAQSGLVSIDQYNSIVAGVEHLRAAKRDTDSRMANLRAGIAELSRQLGISVEQANIAMTLRSDPYVQSLSEQLAKQTTELAVLTSTHGPNAPRVMDLNAEKAAVTGKLIARGIELTGNKQFNAAQARDLNVYDARARLLERLIGAVSDLEALIALSKTLSDQIDAEQERVLRLAPMASRLDDLKRDVQVAEAVFSSALARIDTGKSDFFASYPMVQTLEAPRAPTKPSSPLPILAVGGGVGASFLILAALVLTWSRTVLLQKILKNA